MFFYIPNEPLLSLGGDGDSLLEPRVAVQQREHEAGHVSSSHGCLTAAVRHEVSLMCQKLLSCIKNCNLTRLLWTPFTSCFSQYQVFSHLRLPGSWGRGAELRSSWCPRFSAGSVPSRTCCWGRFGSSAEEGTESGMETGFQS